uniref:Dihydrofolate reductase n=1 Tax=Encephalitozoon cuniculi TaxID=6035 RepID=M1JIG9_ENCCN|nr:dihydrofolate reductase [Encephalitozoon cuniculi]
MLALVVALASHRGIGNANALPWPRPLAADMAGSGHSPRASRSSPQTASPLPRLHPMPLSWAGGRGTPSPPGSGPLPTASTSSCREALPEAQKTPSSSRPSRPSTPCPSRRRP